MGKHGSAAEVCSLGRLMLWGQQKSHLFFILLSELCLSDAFLSQCERADRQADTHTAAACLSPVHWLSAGLTIGLDDLKGLF